MANINPRKKRMQLALEEEELRSLRIPSSAHRGSLSPSKNSFLPTLQEQEQGGRDHVGSGGFWGQSFGKKYAARGRASRAGDDGEAHRDEFSGDQEVMAYISAEHLDGVKQDFISAGGSLNVDQFVQSMLQSLDAADLGNPTETTTRKSVRVAGDLGSSPPPMRARGVKAPKASSYAAAVIDLFSHVDVHGEGFVTWDEVSNYLVEQGMVRGDLFTVDSIKTYEASTAVDQSKHDSAVERLVYFEQVDTLMCLTRGSRGFRLYDPKRCTVKAEVTSAHRGSVVNSCYLETINQIATCSSDMTICMWDHGNLGLRNRIAARDVQLCLEWDPTSRHLFSGSIEGTLSCWDIQNMCLADSQRGKAKGAMNDLLMVPDLNMMASASADGGILMWDTATMRTKRTFKGHKKGTFSLAYSMDYRCLLTAGLEQEALVWNPYVERVPIFRLKGHTHALCGVAVVPGTPQILSADIKGMFRLWDMRNFRCVQSFGGGGAIDSSYSDLNSFCVMPMHRRLAAGGARVTMYDYMDEWGGEEVTDIGGVTDALYNANSGEFYTVSKTTVKAWNAASGTLFKVLRDISEHEITSACLADNGRKLYLGDSRGHVTAHGLKNGTKLKEFEKHQTDISCLAIWKGTSQLFSASWDGIVKVHSDESHRPQTKAEFQHHRDGVTCMEACPELMLLATGSTDTQVCLYDLKTLKLEHTINRLQHVISDLSFLSSRCLLAIADQGGFVSLWRVRPHPSEWERVHTFQNLPVLLPLGEHLPPPECKGPPIPLSGVAFAPPQSVGKPQPLIYTADAKGGLRCWDLSLLCERRGIYECNVRELFENRHFGAAAPVVARAITNGPPEGFAASGASSPTRSRSREACTMLTAISEADLAAPAGKAMKGMPASPAVHDGGGGQLVRLLHESDGHDDAVLKLQLTERPAAVITCGQDRRVCTWGERLERTGMLLQRKDGSYKFPYDPTAVQALKLNEAAALLTRIGPVSPRSKPKLPALPVPMSARVANENNMLASLIIGKKRPKAKVDPDDTWRMAAENVLSNPNAADEDYQMLFAQMTRIGQEADPHDPQTSAIERLNRHAQVRNAERAQHRCKALSEEESSAADRLAEAMAALGADDFGAYASMARALRPKPPKISAPLTAR